MEFKKTKSALTVAKESRQTKSSRIPGFYRVSIEQRLGYLQKYFSLSDHEIDKLREGTSLRTYHAVNMIENAVGIFGVPLGIATNFQINKKDYLVPMAIEEPSVVAAASKAALLVRESGGFEASADDPLMIGQIQILNVADLKMAARRIIEAKQRILDIGNNSIINMRLRGGGLIDFEIRDFPSREGDSHMLVVHMHINVCEAMGANTVNTVCEATAPLIEELSGGEVNMCIVSNLADKRLARAKFSIPVEKLKSNGTPGEVVARRLVESGYMAEIDPYRATTHNKGLFNGISAVALALGQDWRAIDAGGHAYAARSGQYRSLTKFEIIDDKFVGSIELPLQVGWVGGTTSCHPGVSLLRKITDIRDGREFAGLLASTGLAQNFAACLALCTDGIQKGHMSLHARSVAASIGVPTAEIEAIAREMVNLKSINVETAEKLYHSSNRKLIIRKKAGTALTEAYAPGKAILFGEHAIVHGYPGIAFPLDIGLKVTIRHDPSGPRFLHPKFNNNFYMSSEPKDFRQFSQAAQVAFEKFGLAKEPIEIMVKSDLVPGVGLGSSAAFSVALTRAFLKYKYGEDYPTDELGTIAHEIEKVFHGNPSGIDDTTVVRNKILWFRKTAPLEITEVNPGAPMHGLICIVEPGSVTSHMVQMIQAKREENPNEVEAIFEQIGNITDEAKVALESGDIAKVGHLMNQNHSHLNKLDLSTPGLNEAVKFMTDNNALGAKMTGAGGGGAILALAEEKTLESLVAKCRERYPLVFPFVKRDVDA